MYEYRDLCEHEQMQLVRKRMSLDYPWHSPPHSKGHGRFMMTAACFEHACHLSDPRRREAFATELRGTFSSAGGTIFAWVVLPNHYHVLWEGNLDILRPLLARLHNGTSTRWNREDNATGRQTWYQCADRRMRSERHFIASVNYIHGNPVKHGWTDRADHWKDTSLHDWLARCGIDHLRTLWRLYPPRNYGQHWDD